MMSQPKQVTSYVQNLYYGLRKVARKYETFACNQATQPDTYIRAVLMALTHPHSTPLYVRRLPNYQFDRDVNRLL